MAAAPCSGMTRIAHLTDLHLLEGRHASRNLRERLRLSLLTFGRTLDAEQHRRRFARALERARDARADHVVITGDLTEDGTPAQFEVLAEVLHESAWDPDDVTLVPGNHDGYDRTDGWWRALEGPMRAFRATSTPGSVTELPGATIVAIATTVEQSCFRACGRIGAEQHALLQNVFQRSAKTERPVVAAMHHPPVAWGLRLGWIEGLLDGGHVRALLEEHAHAHVLCGHMHENRDFCVGRESAPRIHAAGAVVESAPLRLYDAIGGRLLATADFGASAASITDFAVA